MDYRRWGLAAAFGLTVLGSSFLAGPTVAGGLDPQKAAQAVDERLIKEQFGGTATDNHAPAPQADDQTFLRRVSLDLVGHPPTTEELTAFSLDTSPDKRARAVERLLAKPEFGENWARYWRDVIFSRRSEDRALLATNSLVNFLTKSFNEDPHWDKIAHKFITATGDIKEEGATAIIMAQMGNAEDTTAEVSRIFLGIQLQCAQCHNHPTDRWKREQFHELAAFFPRVSVRPVRKGEQRSFAIVSMDKQGKDKAKKPRKGTLEHHMPDLNHPEKEGKLMKPVFFVTGQKLDKGKKDQERRDTLADWITSPSDRWFAKAFANRMWSELVGRGFCEPVDDLGPDRACSAPHTLDYLAEHFATSGYDVKWLMATITATEAYARQSRSRTTSEAAPFTACCTQRLRGDQLFNSLTAALGVDEGPKRPKDDNPRREAGTPRGKLNRTFEYDPSVRRDEVAGSIPQALFLMNAPELNRALNVKQGDTKLGKLLEQESKNDAVVEELYLRCLAREPHAAEVATCLEYVGTVGDRTEAFEDILWSLVNSTEFLNRK